MNYFNAAGDRERILLRLLSEKFQMDAFIPMPESCRFDALASKSDKVAILEAKVRQLRHDKWDSTLIEKAKYSDLLNRLYKDECHKALYVEFYIDGFARVYNLAKIDEPKWIRQSLNKTTMGDNETIDKLVGYIDYENALLINISDLYEAI